MVHNYPDATIWSDGSGSYLKNSCCSVSIVYLPAAQKHHILTSYFKNGTVNLSELIGILQALYFIKASDYPARKINIYSDSEVTVKIINKEYEQNKDNALAMFWASFWSACENYRFDVKAEWVPRNSTQHNTHCDKLAGFLRKEFDKLLSTAETEVMPFPPVVPYPLTCAKQVQPCQSN